MDRFVIKINNKDSNDTNDANNNDDLLNNENLQTNNPISQNINPLQERINQLKSSPNQSISWYKETLEQCTRNKEFAACVYVYDCLKQINQTPPPFIYQTIEKLHSKTLPENNTIALPYNPNKTLQPRRRIHKIIKGFYYSDNYKAVEKYMPQAIEFIHKNQQVDKKNKIVLIKKIKEICKCSEKDAGYIVTKLKRSSVI